MNLSYLLAILFLAAIDPAFLRINSKANYVKLRGKGAFFPLDVFQTWIASFRSIRERFQPLHMTYTTLMSSIQSDLLKTIGNSTHGLEYTAYTGSSAELNDINYKKYPDLRILPAMAG